MIAAASCLWMPQPQRHLRMTLPKTLVLSDLEGLSVVADRRSPPERGVRDRQI